MGHYVSKLIPTRLMVLTTIDGKRVRVKSISKYGNEVRVIDIATGLPTTVFKAELLGLPAC